MKRPFKRAAEPRITPAAITYRPLGPYTAPQVVPTSRDDPNPAFVPQPPPEHVWDYAKNKIQENQEVAKLTRVFKGALQGVAVKNRAPKQGSTANPLTFVDQVTRAAKKHARDQHGLNLDSEADRQAYRNLPGKKKIEFGADGKIVRFGAASAVDRGRDPTEEEAIKEQGELLSAQRGFGRKKQKRPHNCKTPYCICQYNKRRRLR